MTTALTPAGRTVTITVEDGGIEGHQGKYLQYILSIGVVRLTSYGYYGGGNLQSALQSADKIIDETGVTETV